MINNIKLVSTIERSVITSDHNYHHLLFILEALDCQIELVEHQNHSELCGQIVADIGNQQPEQTIQNALPTIRLTDLVKVELLEPFLIKIILLSAFHRFNSIGLSRKQLIEFYSGYKLLLLAYSQKEYRLLGPLVATMASEPLTSFVPKYLQKLLSPFDHYATKEAHINVIQHIQGYFRPHLSALDKQSLTELIDGFRQGTVPLLQLIDRLIQYQQRYPSDYLAQQYYLTGYRKLLAAVSQEFGQETLP